jgi:hypothetical protein
MKASSSAAVYRGADGWVRVGFSLSGLGQGASRPTRAASQSNARFARSDAAGETSSTSWPCIRSTRHGRRAERGHPGTGHWVAEQTPEEMLAALTAFLAPYRDRG